MFLTTRTDAGLRISADDLKMFQLLKEKSSSIAKALKALKGRNTVAEVENDSD